MLSHSAGSVRKSMQVHRSGSGEIVEPWDGRSVQDLHREYGNIFKHGNRNAASHLWSTFLIDRAVFMTRQRFLKLSAGYCAVSGSPVSPGDATRYKLRLERVDGLGREEGFMYYCCWPCVCDTQDFIRVDTKTIRTAEGSHEYLVAVIGNPCNKPFELSRSFVQPFDKRSTTIYQAAPEVRCDRSRRLEGATVSDNGYIIISLFFQSSKKSRAQGFQDEQDFEFMCEDRKRQGYNSGMGEIFRRVAAISPVKVGSRGRLLPPSKMSVKHLRAEATRRGLDVRGTERRELAELIAASQRRELRKLTAKQLRTQATQLGLDLRGIADKEDLVSLLEHALRNDDTSEAEATEAQKTFAQMSIRELKAEVAKQGLDARGCLEKYDFVRLLEENLVSSDAKEHEATTTLDQSQRDPSAVETVSNTGDLDCFAPNSNNDTQKSCSKME